jgi:transmembrane 9 superfamily protein 2/4
LRQDDLVNFKVNSLTSDKTALPVEYYKLPFCQPPRIRSSAENLGEVLRGDRIFNSLYQMQTKLDETCKVVCRGAPLTKAQAQMLKKFIDDEYRVNMILDNLPAAVRVDYFDEDSETHKSLYERGFPVGFKDDGSQIAGSAVPGALEKKFVKAASWFASKGVKGGSKKRLSLDDGTFFVNNHLRFTVLLHSDVDTKSSRIVGFEVAPVSVRHDFNGAWNELDPKLSSCSALNHPSVVFEDDGKTKPRDPQTVPPQRVEEGASIVFTYDVAFRESPVKWASRWDVYLQMADGKGVHWFSVVNSCLVVLFLSAMVAMIIVRLLKRDISKYNALETIEEAQEESGWKLVHGDVFRAPAHATSLALLVGTGTQLLFMTFVVMVFAVLGFLSPANRGGLMTAALTLFAVAGFFNGYFSARVMKLFASNGAEWKQNATRAAFFSPGVAFAVFFLLNLLCWEERSAGAAPFTALLSICALWFLVNVPLVFLGAYVGKARAAPELPVRTNKIPRRVPPQPWYMRGLFTALAGGLLPFAAVFIELFFILSSMWHHQVYYVFGILFLVLCIALVTCAEVAIVLCYFQLCSEDYEWWWRACANSGSSALYVFMYSAWYFFANLEISRAVPSIMYFAYMALVSAGFAAVTGTVGFLACFAFCRAIYGSVKID